MLISYSVEPLCHSFVYNEAYLILFTSWEHFRLMKSSVVLLLLACGGYSSETCNQGYLDIHFSPFLAIPYIRYILHLLQSNNPCGFHIPINYKGITTSFFRTPVACIREEITQSV